MNVVPLGVDQQWGLKGHCICLPIDVNDTVTKLPRLPSEDGTVVVQLMRRMKDKKPYKYGNVRRKEIKEAVERLVESEVYKTHNITLRPDWENEWEKDFAMLLSKSSEDFDDMENRLDQWDELLTDEEKVIEEKETLFLSTFLNDCGIKIAPAEGKTPLYLTRDPDIEVLGFPCAYGGKARTFKIPLTPVQLAKADIRNENRRLATNIQLLLRPQQMLSLAKQCFSRKTKMKIP